MVIVVLFDVVEVNYNDEEGSNYHIVYSTVKL